jgi:hypothetical protein
VYRNQIEFVRSKKRNDVKKLCLTDATADEMNKRKAADALLKEARTLRVAQGIGTYQPQTNVIHQQNVGGDIYNLISAPITGGVVPMRAPVSFGVGPASPGQMPSLIPVASSPGTQQGPIAMSAPPARRLEGSSPVTASPGIQQGPERSSPGWTQEITPGRYINRTFGEISPETDFNPEEFEVPK